MLGDDLNRPLGFDPSAAELEADAARTLPWRAIAWGGCAVLAASLATFAYSIGDGDGEPRVVAGISVAKKPDPPAPPPIAPPPPAAGVSLEATGSIPAGKRIVGGDEVEYQNGVKIVRRGGGAASGAIVIQVPDPAGTRLAAAPDLRLVEKTKQGPLPKIGPDGARPGDVYARPVAAPASLRPGAPRIAILVGGLGLASGQTQDAISKLPPAVTLGFAPYGSDLERQAARAREAGHELLLQAPMEPFDALQNDPGPHMLRAGAEAAQNLDDLRWLMSRFAGYAGIGNFLGARFSAKQGALEPVLSEINSRGLYYLDDGVSPQSLAPGLAPTLGLPFAKADLVIDLDRKPEAILAALASLEAVARARGHAIGVASALPETLEQVAKFAQGLERRGILLTPVSALTERQAPNLAARP